MGFRKKKMNSIDWLFNQTNARKAVVPIGARNLTIVEAVIIRSGNKEEVVASYDKMVEYNSTEANIELEKWIEDQGRAAREGYVYFRFKRWN